MIDPNEQFQIGDLVLYVQEGVYTRVSGYVWLGVIGALPKIIMYELECGASVPKEALVQKSSAARYAETTGL